MSTLSSVNVTDVNLVLKERTHMRLCINMLIFTHNLGNWLIVSSFVFYVRLSRLNKDYLLTYCLKVHLSSKYGEIITGGL